MLFCNNCKLKFKDEEIVKTKNYLTENYYEYIYVCPRCESNNVEDIYECINCGKLYFNNTFCKNCAKNIINTLEGIRKEFCLSMEDYTTILQEYLEL